VAARAVLLPVDPPSYYAAQALFVGPLLVLLATIFAAVAHRLTRGEGRGTWRELWPPLAATYAGVLLLCFLLPDWIAYLLAGRHGMARAMRFYAPLTPLGIILGAAWHLHRRRGVSRGRAALAALAALVAQAAVGVPLLR
jgi:hypothetical protein